MAEDLDRRAVNKHMAWEVTRQVHGQGEANQL